MMDNPVPVEFYLFKNLDIRLETDDRSAKLRLLYHFYFRFWFPLFVFLDVLTAIPMHFGFHMKRQCVHHRRTDAVESARNFVTGVLAAEFSAGVENGENSLEC